MAAGDVPAQARVFDSLGQGWTNMWPVFWMLLLFGLLEMIAGGISEIPSALPLGTSAPVLILVGLLSIALPILVAGPLGLGVIKGHLAATRGEKPQWSDLGYGFRRWPQAVLLTLVTFLIVVGGLLLLIIPGIYFAIKLTFAGYRFVHDEMDAMDAIKASWDDTKGRWWSVFGLALLTIPIIIAGFLALGVGFFVAIVLIEQMTAVYFRSLSQ